MNTYQILRRTVFGMIVAALLWSGTITASAEEITDEQLIETLETPDTFTVKVPKTISANSAGNISTNIISNGIIQGYEKLQISIPDTITMTQNGKSSVKCNIASENTEITFDTLKQTANTNFSINTNKLTAGTWTGKIEISITKEYYPGLYSKDFKTYIPWNEFVKENGDYFGEKQETTNTNYTSFQKLTDSGKININGVLVYTDDIDWDTKLYIQGSNLSAVIYPDNVININDSFTRSPQLAYINLSTAATLDEYCFNDTPNMQVIHMENSLITRIPNQAFAKTGSAKIYWPSNLKEIGEYSFEYSNIETFDIPDSVWKIEANAFNYTKAKKIIFPANLKALGYGVAYNSDLEILDMSKCNKLVNCIIKDYELDIPEEVTEVSDNSYIGGYCFANAANHSLKTVVLNDNIEAIGDSMFRYQSNIETINFPKNLIAIGDYAFSSCYLKGDLDLSNCKNLDYIGEYSFQDSDKLTSIKLSSCRIVGCNAFCGAGLKMFTAPANLKYIGSSAFSSNNNLEIIDLSETDKLSFYDYKKQSDRDFYIASGKAVLENIKEYGSSQFSGCPKLNTVKFGKNITFLPERLFNYDTALKTIDLPDSITGMGQSCFAYSGLTEITMPAELCSVHYDVDQYDNFLNGITYSEVYNSPYTLREFAFQNCKNLKIVDFSKCIKMKRLGWNSYTMGSAVFSKCTNLETVILPPNLEYLCGEPFEGCSILKNITFSNTLKEIGYSVFANCSSLGEIDLSNTQLTTIGYKAFYGCTTLTLKGSFPSTLERIESYAFNDCKSLETLDLSNTQLTMIGDNAFYGCTALTLKGTFPNTLKTIGRYAFNNCKALTTLDLSNTQLTKITYASFQDCTSLTSVKLPPSLTETEESCFYRDAAITEIDFSNTKLKKIGNQSFVSCSGLKIVKLPDTLIQIDNRAFWNCYNLSQINFPASLSTIQYSAFQECLALKDIDLSACVDLTEIPENCFRCSSVDNCTYTEDANIKLPDSIITIGNYAFQKRKNIRTLNWPVSLETIGNNAFDGTNGIKFLDFRNTKLTAIGENAFWNCNGIQFVWFPKDTQITLKKDAFVYCQSLYLDIPDNVSIASDNSFAWVSISYEGTDSNYPWNAKYASTKHAGLYNGDNYTPWKELHKSGKICQSGNYIIEGNDKTIAGDLIIPDNVLYIDKNAFSDNDNITSITTGKGLLAIYKWNPFSNCDNLKKLDFGNSINLTSIPVECCINSPKLETVILPDSIVDINCLAFKNCPNLSIDIPDTVNFIGIAALLGVKNINYNGNSDGYPWGAVVVNGVSLNDSVYGMYKDDGSYVSWNNMISSGLICSDAWGYKICNGIDKSKISGTIKFPYEMTGLSTYAFNGCTQLKAVEFSPLFENAWWGTFDNTQIEILDFSKTNLGWIQSNNYANMPNLKTVILDKTPLYDTIWGRKQITEIQTGGFSNNPQMSIVVPSYITTIGENAFLNAKSVTYTGTATGSPWGAKSINNTQASAASLASVSLSDIPEEEDAILLPPTTVSDGNADVANDAPIINEEENIKDSVSSGDAETNTSDEIISDDTEDTLSDDDWMQLALSVSDGNAAPGDREKCEEKLTEMQESGITPEISELMQILMQIIISVILPRYQWY